VNETIVTIVGNVVAEPKYNVSRSGVPFCSFRLATNPRTFDRVANAWVDGPSSFYGVTAWRWAADNVHASMRPGDPVVVTGRQRVRRWEHDGKSGTAIDIDVIALGHDVTRGTSQFTRVLRQAGGSPEQQDAAAAHDRMLVDELEQPFRAADVDEVRDAAEPAELDDGGPVEGELTGSGAGWAPRDAVA
jgi:single-strand DNA-binding protein